MKRKKVVFLIMIMLLLFPFTIHAEECKKTDIIIEKVELSEIRGNAEETSTASNDHNQIHLNTKMNVVGDSITYKAVIKNTSNSDYVFDKTQLTKDYINYDIRYEDDSNIIKAGEEKVIYLRLNYENKPQVETLSNGVYTSNSQVSLHFVNESGTFINPETKNNVFFVFLIITIIIGIIITQRKNHKKATTMIVILSLIILPKIVSAICTCTLDIHLNLEIDARDAIFLPGQEVNVKMKQLAGDDTSTVTNGYNFLDQNIISIKYSNFEPIASNKEEKNIVSTPDSPYPIYMWYDNGTIYWWSEDKTPALNKDASYMFAYTFGLNDISGISSFDITNTKHLFATFCSSNLLRLDSLKKWDVSNVTNMQALFAENKLLESIEGIEKWNVSNVTNLSYLFESCYSLEEVDFSNWSTSSLKTINNMLGMWNENHSAYTDCKLRKIILSESFETSKVENMYAAFANNTKIEDYSFLLFLDMSNVTNASHMFLNNHNLRNLNEFKDWDISNMENIFQMFALCTSLEDISAIKNWNVGKVTNFSGLFYENNNLYDASPINDWNISSEASFINMFYNVPTHPEFSAISGSWNYGTFIPS